MRYLYLITLCFWALSCNQNDVVPNTCGVKRPLQDLEWLKTKMQTTTIEQVVQARYQDQTVYMTASCSRCTTIGTIHLYSCDGDLLCQFPAGLTDSCKVYQQLTDEKVLFDSNSYN